MNSGDIVNEILDIAQNSSKMPGFGSKVLVDIDRLEAVASRLSQSITSDNLEAIEVLKQKNANVFIILALHNVPLWILNLGKTRPV